MSRYLSKKKAASAWWTQWGAYSVTELFRDRERVTAKQIAECPATRNLAVCILCSEFIPDKRALRLLACDFASYAVRQATALHPRFAHRLRRAIVVARDYARGRATEKRLNSARDHLHHLAWHLSDTRDHGRIISAAIRATLDCMEGPGRRACCVADSAATSACFGDPKRRDWCIARTLKIAMQKPKGIVPE